MTLLRPPLRVARTGFRAGLDFGDHLQGTSIDILVDIDNCILYKIRHLCHK